MKVESLSCNNCGAPLDVGQDANYASCAHCGARLAIHRTGSAAYTEVLGDIKKDTSEILQHTDTPLDQNRQQTNETTRARLEDELETLDRKWEADETDLSQGFHGGRRGIPEEASVRGAMYAWGIPAILSAILFLSGVILTIFQGPAGGVLAVLGLVLFGVFGSGLLNTLRDLQYAKRYDRAYDEYLAKHDAVVDELARLGDEPAPPPRPAVRRKSRVREE